MPVPYATIHIRDFVKTGVDGVVDLELSSRMLRQLAGEARARGTPRILADLRDSQPGMSLEDAAELVTRFDALGISADMRIAVLMPPESERLKRGLYLQAIASGKGYAIRPFLDFEAAAEWLSER